jgi:hypothetical protein
LAVVLVETLPVLLQLAVRLAQQPLETMAEQMKEMVAAVLVPPLVGLAALA